MLMSLSEDQRIASSPTRERPEALLVDLQESLQIYLEALTGLPVQIRSEKVSPYLQHDFEQRGVAQVDLPDFILLTADAEQNRQAYTSLATLAAGKILYSQGFDEKELPKILNAIHDREYGAACEQAQQKNKTLDTKTREAILESIPITPSDKWTIFSIVPTMDVKDAFTTHAKHPKLLEEIIEIVEQGRIMAHFFHQYPAAYPWVARNLGYFYYEEVVEELRSLARIKEEHEHTRSLRNSATAQQTLEQRQLQLASKLALNHLRYSCIFQTQSFLDEHLNTLRDQESSMRSLAEEHPKVMSYNAEPFQSREQAIQNAQHLSAPWFALAQPTFTPRATIHDSLRAALDIYLLVYDAIQKKKIPEYDEFNSAKTGTRASKESRAADIVRHLQKIVCAHYIETRRAHELQQPRAEAFETRHVKNAEVYPYYPEWNYVANSLTDTHFITVRETGILTPKNPVFPFPQLDARILNSLTAQLQLLQPEGLVRMRRQKRGTFDERAYARFLAKINAGIPARSNFYYRDERHERSATALVLLDLSDSTGQLIDEQHTILDKLKEATLYFAQAIRACGDNLAVYGVTSSTTLYTRERTALFCKVKDFEDDCSEEELRARLTQLEPLYNNRDGAFIRHGATLLAEQPEETKLLIYLNDGAPHDMNLYEWVDNIKPTDSKELREYKERKRKREEEPEYKEQYAWEDIARAVKDAEGKGVTPLIIRVNEFDPYSFKQMSTHGINFRRANLHNMHDLVNAWAEAYTQLAR